MSSLSSVFHHASISERFCPVRIKTRWELPRNHPPVKGLVWLQWARVGPEVCNSQWCFFLPFMPGEHCIRRMLTHWGHHSLVGSPKGDASLSSNRGFYLIWEQQLEPVGLSRVTGLMLKASGLSSLRFCSLYSLLLKHLLEIFLVVHRFASTSSRHELFSFLNFYIIY